MTIKQQILEQIEIARKNTQAAIVTEEERRLFHERFDAAERAKQMYKKHQQALIDAMKAATNS